MLSSTQRELVPAAVLPLGRYATAVGLGNQLMYSSRFISKNRLNRQNDNRIQAAQNAAVVQPVTGRR